MVEPRVAKEIYIESMWAELEGLLGEVMEAVNDAPGRASDCRQRGTGSAVDARVSPAGLRAGRANASGLG